MRTVYLVIGILFFSTVNGQSLNEQLGKAIDQLEKDNQFSNAIISICVVDGKTGRPLYEKNPKFGLAPASCQKLVTSVAAFELLGKDYRFKTEVKLHKNPDSSILFIQSSGDPTIGSWRWEETKMSNVYKNILSALKKKNVAVIEPGIYIEGKRFTYQPIPDGWVWQDIGNYFGAGAWNFNWHENQYDLLLRSGNTPGDPTEIKGFDPRSATMPISNFIVTGKKGSGDNGYIYSAPFGEELFATGTIPPGQDRFVISGSMTDPSKVFSEGLISYLNRSGILIGQAANNGTAPKKMDGHSFELIHTIVSPPIDSINYWFLKKSVNLFGEAFVKTIAYERTGLGSTDTGVAIIKNFWHRNGIQPSALNIIDGSGLSPANRVTTSALVRIMQYAKEQPWFNSFYNALPEMNGIKMKDGYIGGVRSYTGYVKARNGAEYTFSFMVNNFYGNAGTVREKMWKVLDLLK